MFPTGSMAGKAEQDGAAHDRGRRQTSEEEGLGPRGADHS